MHRQPRDPRPTAAGSSSRPVARTLHIDLPAEAATASVVRDRVERWLRQREWPTGDVYDIVLAVHEAVANVIDHAYRDPPPGRVWVVANVVPMADETLRYVQAIVRDCGRWRPIPDDPGYRGHGLNLMNGCMHRVDIRHHADGTVVHMISAAAPAVP